MVALIALIEYINKISIEEKALFFAEAGDFPVGVVFCYQYLPQMKKLSSAKRDKAGEGHPSQLCFGRGVVSDPDHH